MVGGKRFGSVGDNGNAFFHKSNAEDSLVHSSSSSSSGSNRVDL